jgi:hypothetical protein
LLTQLADAAINSAAQKAPEPGCATGNNTLHEGSGRAWARAGPAASALAKTSMPAETQAIDFGEMVDG